MFARWRSTVFLEMNDGHRSATVTATSRGRVAAAGEFGEDL
jgi:hypothetical protein